MVLKLSEIHGKGYPTELADEEFARLVNLYTKGQIKVDVFPGGQISGDEKVVIEQVKIGAIAIARVSSGALGLLQPPAQRLRPALHLRFEGPHVGVPERRRGPEDAGRSGPLGICRPLLV